MIHISLFSGIGGFEIAAEWMGWRNLISCDINEFGNKVRKYYWPDGYCHTDIKTLTYEKINSELSARFGTGWRDDEIILTGGFPCQPYSAAGKRLGKEDERHLWPEMLRVIQEVKPTYIVGENVRGLTNWNGGVVFEEVCADLEACGYEVQPLLLPACAVGAPHRRDRVWFVAYAAGHGHDAKPTQENNIRQNNKQPRTQRKRSTEGLSHGWPTPKPHCDGLDQCDCQNEIDPSQGGQHAFGDTQQSDGDGTASDTNSRGLEGSIEIGRNSIDVERSGESWTAADTEGERNRKQQEKNKPSKNRFFNNNGKNEYASDTNGIRLWGQSNRFRESGFIGKNSKGSNWQDFPTQSPICSGDDGLPTQLDGITFPKWRNESIKAYGNAIVPQVAFEIFKALVQGK